MRSIMILLQISSIGHARFPIPEFRIYSIICFVLLCQRTLKKRPKLLYLLHFPISGLKANPKFVSFLNLKYGAFANPVFGAWIKKYFNFIFLSKTFKLKSSKLLPHRSTNLLFTLLDNFSILLLVHLFKLSNRAGIRITKAPVGSYFVNSYFLFVLRWNNIGKLF